jgi:hypothetical protein
MRRRTNPRGRLPLALLSIAVAVAVIPTASGQGPPALREGSAWDVRRFGAVGDGKTDCTDAFQRAADAAARRLTKTVFIPPGHFVLRRPVFVDGEGVRITGMGDDSFVEVQGMISPAFVFGVRRVEKDGRAIGARHRPDVFGKLDRSVAPERGKRSGLATLGEVYLISVAHPAQVGMRTRRTADVHFDYWQEMTAFTLELCVEPPPGRGWENDWPIVGLGVNPHEPCPWYLSAMGYGGRTLRFGFKTSDIPEGYGEGFRTIDFPLEGAKPPYRVRVWIDFETGKVGAVVNDRVVADSVTTSPKDRPWRPGLRFTNGRSRYPFLVGVLGENPDPNSARITPLNLYGLRVSRAVRGRPANDAEAYLKDDDDTVFYLPLTGPPGRAIDLATGRAAGGQGGTAVLLHTGGYLGGVNMNAVTDLHVTGSPGVLIGGVLRFRMERVRLTGGMVGFGSLPIVVSYPVILRDCEFNGFDAAVSLFRCELRGSGIDFERWGQTALRLHGCSASMQDMMFFFETVVSESAVDILRGEGWGRYRFRNLNIDSEARGFGRAVVRCEPSTLTQGVLDIDGLAVSKAGKTAALLELIDAPDGGYWTPHRLEARNLNCYDSDYAAVLRVDGPNWYGHVDVSVMRPPHLDYRGKAGTTSVKIVSERGPKKP